MENNLQKKRRSEKVWEEVINIKVDSIAITA